MAKKASFDLPQSICENIFENYDDNSLLLICASPKDNIKCNNILKDKFDSDEFLFATFDGFTNDLINSIVNRTNADFREKYTSAKLLVLFDLQLLVGRSSTQEEVYFILSNRMNAGLKTIIFSPMPLSKMAKRLEDVLFEFLKSGYILDIISNGGCVERFKPYSGEDSYIFISYSHQNTAEAMEVIKNMQKDGYRVWYDEGIDPGSEWDDFIAEKIENCGFFIALISTEYLESENCKDELKYSRDLGKKRLLIYLEEDAKLTGGGAMRSGRIQAIHRYAYPSPDEFASKLYSTPALADFKD